MTEWNTGIVLALILGYALGSIPFGVILTKMAGGGDVRDIGSGNIGATNVLRTGRKGLAALTLLFDLLKGTAAVLAAQHWLPGTEIIAAAAAFFGHLYPVWIGFKGGKGLATYAGILFGLYWPLGAGYGLVWLAILAASRISSVAGLSAAVAAPVLAWGFDRPEYIPALFAISAIAFWKHRANIGRLIAGREPRIGKDKA
jgi:glycerol-3-phosphate acyltransferase PlsY